MLFRSGQLCQSEVDFVPGSKKLWFVEPSLPNRAFRRAVCKGKPAIHAMGVVQARWDMSENEERKAAGHFTGARWKTGETWRGTGMPVQEMLGQRLRSCYGEIQQQPLPRRLNDLLDELDAKPDEPPVARR